MPKSTQGCRSKERKIAGKKQVITPARIRSFRKTIYDYYRTHRRDFPWRTTANPYHILVSEVMLQQTQAERVVDKYTQFLKAFPHFRALARAPLHEVLTLWQGLGYNRRAVALKQLSVKIADEMKEAFPSDEESLRKLPGIGKYTAAAVVAFAFNEPALLIETNIRTVFIHFFFSERELVDDRELLPLIESTLDQKGPREWYYALMDYGAMLKKNSKNHNAKSAHYRKQPPFQGSNRQVRGVILKLLLGHASLTEKEITTLTRTSREAVRSNLIQLEREGFIKKRGGRFSILSAG